MTVRKEVKEFVSRGPLPSPDEAQEEHLAVLSALLGQISPPVSVEEAALLMHSFGPDECFGLAWTVLHLIETAPGGAPIDTDAPPTDANEWVLTLWQRAHRTKA